MQPKPPTEDAASRIIVSGHQVDVGDTLRAHATEQLEALGQKYFDKAEDATCTFSRTGHGGFACAIRVHSGRGLFFDGEARACRRPRRLRAGARTRRQAAAPPQAGAAGGQAGEPDPRRGTVAGPTAPRPATPISAPPSTTSSRRPTSRSTSCATATSAGARVGLDGLDEPNGSPISAGSSRCPATSRSRWRCATTATSSGPTTRSSATAAASCSRSSHDRDGRLLDLGTKGSGRTPWSRGARRAADAEGRRARGAGHRDARGAGRRHLEDPSA